MLASRQFLPFALAVTAVVTSVAEGVAVERQAVEPTGNSSKMPENRSQVLPLSSIPRYTVRICNGYAFDEPLEVSQARTGVTFAKLEYKFCEEKRIEIEVGEQIDFRVTNPIIQLLEDSGMKEEMATGGEAFKEVFALNDLSGDGLLNFKEYKALMDVLHPWSIFDSRLDLKTAKKGFNEIDTNNDARLSLKEFADYASFGSANSVGDDLVGTFLIGAELPDPNALETLLMIVVHRKTGKQPGSHLSAAFTDHAFGPKELHEFGQNAILCIVDTYIGEEGKKDKVHIAYDTVPDGTNFSHGHHEVLPYNNVVGIHKGFYQLDLGRGHSEEIDEEVFYARPQVNYVVIRVGDTTSETSIKYEGDLIVFPKVETSRTETEASPEDRKSVV